MNIQEVYNQSKKNILFNDSKKFNQLRENLLNNFDLSPKIKKNNESLKHLDPHILEFSYNYNKLNRDISYLTLEGNKINIDVIDGRISTIHKNINDKTNIDYSNINNFDTKIETEFLNFQKYFNNDYILNLNSIMLNSGYQITVPQNQEATIFISNSISQNDLTVFQKNLITCSKYSKVVIIEEFNEEKPSNNNIVNFINLEEGSDVVHLIFQKNNKKANLQLTSYSNCEFKS